MLVNRSELEGDRDIVSERTFDVPRARLYRAWMNPDEVARWWGPAGFTNTFHEFDPRPNGHWRFVMHGPNGGNYDNHSVFREVVENERIVFDHESPPRFHVVVTFHDVEGEPSRSRLLWRGTFPSAADLDKVKGFAVQGNRENLDRLHALLGHGA